MKNSFLKKIRHAVLGAQHEKIALSTLRRLEDQHKIQSDRLKIPFEYKAKGVFKSIKPMQSYDEIERLYERVLDLKPKRVLEIGTCHGGTLYLWCQAASSDALILSLDLPEGDFGGGYHKDRTRLYQSFSHDDQKLHLLRADSHQAATFEMVREVLSGELLDFLFIDGDHRYEGVKADFEKYKSLVRPGGLIALHDICVRPSQPDIEVYKFWEELKSGNRDAEELIERGEEKSKIGIGLIYQK